MRFNPGKKLMAMMMGVGTLICVNANATVSQQDPQIKRALQAHIEFLADDHLKGRDTGSVEYEISARYVASHFKQYGLIAGGDDGSYLQQVPLLKSQLDKRSATMTLFAGEQATEFEFPKQFMTAADPLNLSSQVRAKLVFAGYGIVSKELGHDDYANIDVKGKIVVVLNGKPARFPSEQGAHVASTSEKLRHANENGAVGIITVHTPITDKVRAYDKYLDYAGRPSMSWKTKDGGVFGAYENLKGGAYVSKETAQQLFSAAGKDLKRIFNMLEKDKVPAGFAMDVEVEFKRKSSHELITSPNVVGMIEGSDPQLKNEYVVYSAHLDHIGVHGDEEDNINNGALDNASGIALMLETARMFSQGERPKRSILFVAVTGEEKGLLGSNYYAHYPNVPTRDMVANINLDMPLILYPFADIIAFGAEHSTMADNVSAAAKQYGIELTPDPMPEQALFVRSDHYSWVKQGVPSIFLVPGMQSKDPNINGGELFGKFIQQHYHQASDDISLDINYDAGVVFSKINFAIGLNIANDPKRPVWHEGDFFGETFGQTQSVN